MTSKYPAWLAALASLLSACSAPATAPVPSSASAPPSLAALPSAGATATATPRTLAAPVGARVELDRRWYTVPDGLFAERPLARVRFEADPSAGEPRARLGPGGQAIGLERAADGTWGARLDLAGVAPGPAVVEVVERVGGAEVVVASAPLVVSAPEYVVWTLDFEGDESGDPELANTAAIADGLKVPMVVLWNPRVWSTAEVRPARAEAMLAWTKDRAAKGDEIGLHLHGWLDWIRATGVTPRTTPTWAGRRDGYDVPLSAYSESETKALLDAAVRQMAEHGLPRPTSFRAGGHFASGPNLRAIAAAGFSVDCTAVPAGTFGALRLPWTLPRDAQPYRPSGDDPSAPGGLSLLESPTTGGNTYGLTATSIQPIVGADLAMLAAAGTVARERRTLNIVSHPGTIVPAERAAIETLFHAFDALRYDRDAGPLRFVTLRQLAKAYTP